MICVSDFVWTNVPRQCAFSGLSISWWGTLTQTDVAVEKKPYCVLPCWQGWRRSSD